MGVCALYKGGRNALLIEEEMRKMDGCDMDKFGALDRSENTTANLGDT